MNRTKYLSLILFVVAPVLAQVAPPAPPVPPAPPAAPAPPVPPVPPGDLNQAITDVASQLQDLQFDFPTGVIDAAIAQAEAQLQALDLQIPADVSDRVQSRLSAKLQNRLPLSLQTRADSSRVSRVSGDIAYDFGTRALDAGKYDDAVRQFDRVIAAKSSRADGATYWRAYALNRLGRRDDALAAIAALRRDYPNSRWLNDAQALEVEVRQNSGQTVAPAEESNDELKLMAINTLLNRGDSDQTVQLLEGILKGGSAPRVKDRALFVLTQSRSPRARQVLGDIAKGSANPDLQLRAIRYLGISRDAAAQQQLLTIYSSSSDIDVKKQILRSLVSSDASAKLLELARTEKEPELRLEAIRAAANSRDADLSVVTALYAAQTDEQAKRAVVDALMARGDAKDLVNLARKETNPDMKKIIVERLSAMHNNKDAMDYMMELLK